MNLLEVNNISKTYGSGEAAFPKSVGIIMAHLSFVMKNAPYRYH